MKRTTDYDAAFLDRSVPATIRLLAPTGGTKPGCLDLARWAAYGRWLVASDLLRGPVPVSRVATNAYGEGCGGPPGEAG